MTPSRSPLPRRLAPAGASDRVARFPLTQGCAVVVEWGERLDVDGAAHIEIEHLGGDRRLVRTTRDLGH